MREFNFKEPGPVLTPEAIVSLEEELGLKLPEDYKQFMLKQNGGVLNPQYAFEWCDRTIDFYKFFPIEGPSEWWSIRFYHDTLKQLFGEYLYPFFCTLRRENVCIDTQTGEVVMAQFGFENEVPVDVWTKPIASSFTEFLPMLYENPDPICPIRELAKIGDSEDVTQFITNGNQIDDKGIYGNTLLYEAAVMGNLEVIKACVENGASLQFILHGAVASGEVEAARLLISLGADVNEPDKYGDRPLSCHGGVKRPGEEGFNNRAVRALLLEHGAIE